MDPVSLKTLLTEHVCVVEFTKLNGDYRRMTCTLKPDLVPQITDRKERTKTPQPDLAVVWDLDAAAWRSFKVTRVISASVQDA